MDFTAVMVITGTCMTHAPSSSQITTINISTCSFYTLPATQLTVPKHWRNTTKYNITCNTIISNKLPQVVEPLLCLYTVGWLT